MQFLLFDVSATLVFLCGYLTVVALQRRRALPVLAVSPGPRPAERLARPGERRQPGETRKLRPAEPCCREWPRLIYPR